MEEILKYAIFSVVLFQNIVLIWFMIMLHFSLSRIKSSYKEISEEEKEKLLISKLNIFDVFKSFIFYNSLKKYLWHDYARKEKDEIVLS